MNTSPPWIRFAVDFVGIACSAVSVFVLALYLSGHVFTSLISAPLGSGHGQGDPLAGWTLQHVRRDDLGIPARQALPVRLKIPKIQVDSAIEYVGLTRNGTMDVPKDRSNVAWFELGQRPGESGSAVIAGHYGFREGKGSAFDDLHKLRAGDTVSTENEEGLTTTFVVREIRRYDPDADSTTVFSSFDGIAHLNLITCEGEWDDSTNQYPSRLIVFTDEEVQRP